MNANTQSTLAIAGPGDYVTRRGERVTVKGNGRTLIGHVPVYYGATGSGEYMEWRHNGEHYCATTASGRQCDDDITAMVEGDKDVY